MTPRFLSQGWIGTDLHANKLTIHACSVWWPPPPLLNIICLSDQDLRNMLKCRVQCSECKAMVSKSKLKRPEWKWLAYTTCYFVIFVKLQPIYFWYYRNSVKLLYLTCRPHLFVASVSGKFLSIVGLSINVRVWILWKLQYYFSHVGRPCKQNWHSIADNFRCNLINISCVNVNC